MTPNIDCYRLGPLPNLSSNGFMHLWIRDTWQNQEYPVSESDGTFAWLLPP